MLCKRSIIANEHSGFDLGDILKILSTNSLDFNNEIVQLNKLAEEHFLNLCICIIDQYGKNFYFLNNTSEQESQELFRAFLVFDKRNRSFYPFYIYDNNDKQHATFSIDDTYILQLFKDTVNNYNWPDYFQTIQQLPNQDTPVLDEQNHTGANTAITNVNHHTGL